ncbi:MAG: hypothetical protein SGARI_002609 [Bacillariaceae sp.]
MALDNETWVIVRSRGVVNIHSSNVKIQIVLRLYSSPAEVLIGFDYASRGFGLLVPGIQNNRVDYYRIKEEDLKNLKGLARFVKVVLEMKVLPKTTRWYVGRAGWVSEEVSPHPQNVASLQKRWRSDVMSPDEIVIRCQVDAYDDPAASGLLVPAIYSMNHEVCGLDWMSEMEWFALSSDTRDKAIETIIDCASTDETPPPGVPAKLFDAWVTEKRSREYLNDELDKIDLDAIYYSAAYKQED